jgi:hypothetical protein
MTNDITGTSFMIPRKFHFEESKKLNAGFYCLLAITRNYLQDLKEAGWTFYVVDAVRGRCHYASRTITVPLWALQKATVKPGYQYWYVAHELAHACALQFEQSRDNHGPIFMKWLIILCPFEFVHYELDYKPRNASAAGITNPDSINKSRPKANASTFHSTNSTRKASAFTILTDLPDDL